MKTITCSLFVLALASLGCGLQGQQTGPTASPAAYAKPSGVYFIDEYGPARDPFADLDSARTEAQGSGRRILLDIGGDWCVWCHIMDDYVAKNEDIAKAMRENFVVVKINVSPENENIEFMGQYPRVAGYPHFYVLDSQGKLLHSQNTGDLEEGQSYNHDAFLAFLQEWGGK